MLLSWLRICIDLLRGNRLTRYFFQSNTRIFYVCETSFILCFFLDLLSKFYKTETQLFFLFLISHIPLPQSLPNLYLISFTCRKCQKLNLIAGYFPDFFQLSQSGTRMCPSLLAPCQDEFGLLHHSPEISSVICSYFGPKNSISLDIRYLSWLSFYHQPYILILSWLPTFYRLYVLLFIRIPKFNQSHFRLLFWCLVHTSLIFIRYHEAPNFVSPVFVPNTYFRNFIFVIFLFLLSQTSSPCCSSPVLAPSLTSVPALIPQSQHSSADDGNLSQCTNF